MIILKSSDDKIFEIDESVANQSKTIKDLIDMDDGENKAIQMQVKTIPLQIPSDVLVKIIEYCKRHATPVPAVSASSSAAGEKFQSSSSNQPSSSKSPDVDKLNCNVAGIDLNLPPSSSIPVVEEDLKTFDEKFVKMNWDVLMSIIAASNFLEIKGLFNLTSTAAADFIKNKSVEEVRELFDIENDFTPEEEAEIRKAHSWAFE